MSVTASVTEATVTAAEPGERYGSGEPPPYCGGGLGGAGQADTA